jgi:amino acid adenylation domain-containing protein
MLQPDAEAICAWDGNLSYRELDDMSAKVQGLLQTYSVEPDSVVPVLFQKSKWAVAAILGVLKAGAAFVLLDPSYPAKRLRDICRDIDASVIVCSEPKLASGLTENVLVICSHTLGKDTTQAHEPSRAVPHNAAYVVYTSGSTGTPKGIVIEHRSFCTNAIASSPAQNLERSSRVLQFASYAFDVSVYECLTPLLLGGCVCIPSESQRVNNLKEAVRDLRVNWAELTPSVARLWHPEDVPTIKTLVMGGEPMLQTDISSWQGKVRLICAYGPAECTVVSTVQSDVKEPGNIGLSPGGTCWVAAKNNHNRLMPIGSIGELIVGGPIVGRGYLNRPHQTANVFITNPDWAPWFRIKDIYHFYKTGDLVRYNSDGTITFIARKDTQVKLNGQRVELGEVEHQARQCFGNAEIAAEVAAPAGQKPTLILFVAERQGFSEDMNCNSLLSPPRDAFQSEARAVKARLQAVLPSHMIPAAYVELTAIPISRTGKVDRKMLRQTIERVPERELRAYRPTTHKEAIFSTRTFTEAQLRYLFSAALGLPVNVIGSSDGFFQLGGDSVSAVRLVGDAREEGLQLTVELLFKHQTIERLAELIQHIPNNNDPPIAPFSLLASLDKQTSITSAVGQCSVLPDQIEDIYPCTPLQEALMAYTAMRPGAFQAQFRFHISRTINLMRLRKAWAIVIDANPILRTRIIHSNTHALQVVVRVGQQLHWDTTCSLNEADESFMSYGESLLHLRIADNPNEKTPTTFTLTMHHAVFDGWSYGLILEAVENAYRSMGVSSQSFTPFIKYVRSVNSECARDFWCSEFQDLRSTHFPMQSPSYEYMSKSIITMHRDIRVIEWPEGSYTSSTIVQLAFAMLIAWCTECMDVLFGLTVTGRNAPVPEVHRLASPTIATFPLRTILQGSLGVRETLVLMQEHITKLIPFEHTGLQQIKSFGTDAANACNFQSLLVIQPAANRRSSEIFLECPGNANEHLKFSTCPLTLVCELVAHGISVKAVIDTAVTTPNDMERMLEQFEYLIDHIISSPESRIDSIIPLPSNGHDDLLQQKQSWTPSVEQKASNYLKGKFTVIVENIMPKGAFNTSISTFVCKSSTTCSLLEPSELFMRPDEDSRQQLQGLMYYLRQTLPPSMSPSMCLPISHLPTTQSGEADRARLCKAASSLSMYSLQSFMKPVIKYADDQIQPEEARLRRIVAHVLGLDPQDIGPKDDFFGLGGDSISAMQVVSLCRKYHLSLTALDIFDGKTIELIASRLKPLSLSTPPSTPGSEHSLDLRFSLLPLRSEEDMEAFKSRVIATYGIKSMESIEDAYPCSEVHQGLLTTQTMEPFDYQSYTIWEVTTGGKNCPVCPIRLRNAWLSLVRRHSALRTCLMDSYPGESSPSKIHVVHKDHMTHVSILSCSDDDVFVKLRESFLHKVIDKYSPHIFTICKTTAGRVFCKLEGSHAFLDAASVLIILQELCLAYDGQLSSVSGPLYSLAVAWLRSLPDGDDQMDYWKRYLENASPCIFPRLRDQIAIDETDETLTFTAPLVNTASLLHFCSMNGLTMGNALQVAWGLMLRWYTGSDKVCFGTLISGRNAPVPGIDKMIGSFFNVLVCQLQFGSKDPLLGVLQRNQVETGNRLLNQHCSLIEVLRFSKHFGKPLFNTCLSVEQPLSMDRPDTSISFKDMETHEPTEVCSKEYKI